MPTFKITLAYDGTNYVGWQRQAAGTSIQGLIEDALRRARWPRRRGRTAPAGPTRASMRSGQVASFSLERAIEPDALVRALNARLASGHPGAGGGRGRRRVPRALRRQHEDLSLSDLNADVISPFERHYAWHVVGALDVDAMDGAARSLEGRHDFAAFAVRRRDHAHDRTDGHCDRGSVDDEPLRHGRTRRTRRQGPAGGRVDRVRDHRRRVSPPHGPGDRRHAGRDRARAAARSSRCATCWPRATGDVPVRRRRPRGCSSSASSIGTYNERMSLEQLLASLPGPPDLPTKRWPARSTSISFPPTSPSSWTATAAGRPSATCRASKATGPASNRCATSSKPRRGSASGC